MGVVEELLKHKEEILIKFLEILEGKESKAKIDLNGIELKVGESVIKLDGSIEFTLIPVKK